MEKKRFFISWEDKEFLKKRALTIIAVAIVAFIVLYSLNLEEIFNTLLLSGAAMAGRNKFIGALVFTAISSISVLVSPFSSAPLVPLANVSFGNFSTILLLLIGWIIGDNAAYYIGSWAGLSLLGRV